MADWPTSKELQWSTQGQHGLDTSVPVQEASDVADGVRVMEHGALAALDLAMHVHGGVHDDAEVAGRTLHACAR